MQAEAISRPVTQAASRAHVEEVWVAQTHQPMEEVFELVLVELRHQLKELDVRIHPLLKQHEPPLRTELPA